MENYESTIAGPFGPAKLLFTMPVKSVLAKYWLKCLIDVSAQFKGLDTIALYKCSKTGYEFWIPNEIAGDEHFYKDLSGKWPNYYREERWEYPMVRSLMKPSATVYEVGCGKGYFLRSIEGRVSNALGLEFNAQAIENKVTKFDVLHKSVKELAAERPESFDFGCAFQVLEHITDPASFLKECFACLRPGGLLAISTPNKESAMLSNLEDAFDMPPHHMGKYSESVYRLIAQQHNSDIEVVCVEPKSVGFETVSNRTRSSFLYRLTHRLAAEMFHAAYKFKKEPGNNILVVFNKRT